MPMTRTPVLWMAAAGMLAGVPEAGARAGGSAADPAARAATVRFGVIDPPVVAQRDVTVRARTSNHPQDPTPLPLECSGLVWAGGTLFATSDRHAHALFRMAVDPATAEIGTPELEVVIRNERNLLRDAEAVAARRGDDGVERLYVVTSLSHDADGGSDPGRHRWARVPVSAEGEPLVAGVDLLDAGPLRRDIDRHLHALRVDPHTAWSGEDNRNTDRWGNAEGLAFVPGSGVALLGMRNPLAGGDALVVALAGLDDAFDTGDPERLRVTDLFRLDLGGRGVSDLCWDPRTRGYLVAAGKSGGPRDPDPVVGGTVDRGVDLESALFWWSGTKDEPPAALLRIPDLSVDAVCRVGDSDLIALGSDEGDPSENRDGRQSLVTLVHLGAADGGGGEDRP